ncbi:MAG TPA: DUF1553 domain-containing protein [Fimbriimonadaceae bacterium]|nr:DUF1553 domain-containing protein [Fimbriimonadaceae bacterium]
MTTRFFFGVLATALGVVGVAFSPDSELPIPKKIDFNRDVRPILSDNCYKCHGPDAAVVAGDLRLDQRASAVKDRRGEFVIKPKHSADSTLLERVQDKDPDYQMPPPDSGKPRLSERQIEILKRWIDQGAEYREHWAFVPPKPAPLPANVPSTWKSNPIDAFVYQGLVEQGLKPEPSADRNTLVRRVALTLTGLPPSPREVEQFVNDKKPGAYERMLDRYLASPRYGEHQARYWLDAVRYGDTHGLHLDNERGIYPYRDWVIRAFNQDVPYDDFVTWQLAGDLLPDPTTEQLIATGYIRMNPTTSEGGAIEAEFLAKNTFDRVDTTSTVLLGLTTGCARCHDHKYDPITQKDYFQLYAYFNSTAENPFDGNELYPVPTTRAYSPEQEAQRKQWQAKLSQLESKVSLAVAESWLTTAYVPLPVIGGWKISGPYPGANFDAVHGDVQPPERGEGDWRDVKIEVGKPAPSLVGRENASAYVKTTLTAKESRTVELRVGSDDGVRVWLNGNLVHDNKVLRAFGSAPDKVALPLKQGGNDLLIKVSNSGGGDGLSIDLGDPVSQQIEKTIGLKSTDPAGFLSAARKLYLQGGPKNALSTEYQGIVAKLVSQESATPLTLIARELPKPREAFVLKRGEYDQPTDKVGRGIPKALGKLPPGAPNNRLGFAQWVTSPSNPLAARVFVNILWQKNFGKGLVLTSEDFGNQGEWPSHPELLDYLAVRFVKSGWSIKQLQRMMLTSNAFRQRSSMDRVKLAKDPENRLLSRGPRFRLDAEVIRDQALYVSGLLREQVGGRGFKPYQPPGLWEAISFVESTTSRYEQDFNDSIYRRSLYLFWKRTSPHPTMLAFDAPMRESCVVRRSRTNTPLQALVTMNETAFLESQRVFAERLQRAFLTDTARLDFAFKACLGRPAAASEANLMRSALKRYRAKFHRDAGAAAALAGIGLAPRETSLPPVETATWMMIASTLFNTDEFLTQH